MVLFDREDGDDDGDDDGDVDDGNDGDGDDEDDASLFYSLGDSNSSIEHIIRGG